MMIRFIKLLFFYVFLLPVGVNARNDEPGKDTIPFEIIQAGRSVYQQSQPIILQSDNAYFEFHDRFFGMYPKQFKFDFENKMIVVFFRTLSSGSFHLRVDYVIETDEKIVVKTVTDQTSEWNSRNMKPVYTIISLKKTCKPVTIE